MCLFACEDIFRRKMSRKYILSSYNCVVHHINFWHEHFCDSYMGGCMFFFLVSRTSSNLLPTGLKILMKWA